jgi:hypothetical protein
MTYRDLLEQIQELDSNQLDMEISICDDSSGGCSTNIEFCINNSDSEDCFDLEHSQPYFLLGSL